MRRLPVPSVLNRREFALSASAAAIAAASPGAVRADAAPPHFIYSNNFWSNLHHTLFFQCSALQSAYGSGVARLSGMSAVAFADFQRARAKDPAAWMSALSTYLEHYAHLDNVSNPVMQKCGRYAKRRFRRSSAQVAAGADACCAG